MAIQKKICRKTKRIIKRTISIWTKISRAKMTSWMKRRNKKNRIRLKNKEKMSLMMWMMSRSILRCGREMMTRLIMKIIRKMMIKRIESKRIQNLSLKINRIKKKTKIYRLKRRVKTKINRGIQKISNQRRKKKKRKRNKKET